MAKPPFHHVCVRDSASDLHCEPHGHTLLYYSQKSEVLAPYLLSFAPQPVFLSLASNSHANISLLFRQLTLSRDGATSVTDYGLGSRDSAGRYYDQMLRELVTSLVALELINVFVCFVCLLLL